MTCGYELNFGDAVTAAIHNMFPKALLKYVDKMAYLGHTNWSRYLQGMRDEERERQVSNQSRSSANLVGAFVAGKVEGSTSTAEVLGNVHNFLAAVSASIL